jgi:hypothetical protein
MNPFVRSSAGIFAATGSKHETTIAERICAALSIAIAEESRAPKKSGVKPPCALAPAFVVAT